MLGENVTAFTIVLSETASDTEKNVAEELRDSSVVLASYNAGDCTRGLVGVVGPTRMDYSRVAAKLSYIAAGLSALFAGGGAPPPGFGKLMIKGDDS